MNTINATHFARYNQVVTELTALMGAAAIKGCRGVIDMYGTTKLLTFLTQEEYKILRAVAIDKTSISKKVALFESSASYINSISDAAAATAKDYADNFTTESRSDDHPLMAYAIEFGLHLTDLAYKETLSLQIAAANILYESDSDVMLDIGKGSCFILQSEFLPNQYAADDYLYNGLIHIKNLIFALQVASNVVEIELKKKAEKLMELRKEATGAMKLLTVLSEIDVAKMLIEHRLEEGAIFFAKAPAKLSEIYEKDLQALYDIAAIKITLAS